MLKAIVQLLNAILARAPRPIAAFYINCVSALSRNVLPEPIARRAYNSMFGSSYSWPRIRFGPRRVLLGRGTVVSIVPHLEEFDGYALFSKRLNYETPVFDWLEQNATTYDLILEIGSNVGVYTVFLDALMKRTPGARLRSIVAFEPSQEAFARLHENLRANRTSSVVAIQAAVGVCSGLQSFYEPSGHLTNGSFIREFSVQFSADVSERLVSVIGAGELSRYMVGAKRTLIKIDVEGFEPHLLAAMSSVISQFHPDLIIEILPGSAAAIETLSALAKYDRFLLTPCGPQTFNALFASNESRDWLLLARD
jgi:FkbM family methyltransferase